MTRLVFHIDRAEVPRRSTDDEIHVWLYGTKPPYPSVGSVGSQAMDAVSRFNVRPSAAAIDFLSIAMAVTAADTFVARSSAPDGWSRGFEIVLPLAEPTRWEPLREQLEAALRFLSSDRWSFQFLPHGAEPPAEGGSRRRRTTNLNESDCVSLFSGGLDSGIGALDLLAAGRRPLLVSHAAKGDAKRQDVLAKLLPYACQRVATNVYPTWSGIRDDSMRTRSILFLALGTLAAQAMAVAHSVSIVDLFVPENGLIALNPPLTPRRLGSHSTRTTHPHFLGGMRHILQGAGIPVKIRNPYEYMTKGEMVSVHTATHAFGVFVAETVSCGKWKRRNQQCGRCVPCLIRRASLHKAGQRDHTSYESTDLISVMDDKDGRDDLIAVQSAVIRLGESDARRWVLHAGPLPADRSVRNAYFHVARRGLDELAAYLRAEGFAL